MAIERQFVIDNIKKAEVKEFLKKELDSAGCGEIDIQRTPMGTRVIVYAQKPGLVIGRKGATIKKVTNELKKRYDLDNPQIEVAELDAPELNAQVMAKNVASLLYRGFHFRRAAYTTLRRIMDAGAIGAQIEISGKLTGGRSRTEKFTDGHIKHSGDPCELYMRTGYSQAEPKQGIIGVKVKILPPGVKLPDDVGMIEEEEKEVAEEVVKPVEKEKKLPEEEEEILIPKILDQTAKKAIKEIRSTDLTEMEIDGLLEVELRENNRKTVIEALTKKKLIVKDTSK